MSNGTGAGDSTPASDVTPSAAQETQTQSLWDQMAKREGQENLEAAQGPDPVKEAEAAATGAVETADGEVVSVDKPEGATAAAETEKPEPAAEQ